MNRNPRQDAGASDSKSAKFYGSLCPSHRLPPCFYGGCGEAFSKVRSLLNRQTDHFPSGRTAFDAVSRLALLVTELRTPEALGYSRLPWAMRALVCVIDPGSVLRRLNRLLVYRF